MSNINLTRFIEAQNEAVYETVLDELRQGRKSGHWMWFIFPQMKGLGQTSTSDFYGIQNLDEAVAYLSDPILGERLIECTEVLLNLSNNTAEEIFGYPDYLKFRSSMTLFEKASGDKNVFTLALEKYYRGQRDEKTLELLNNEKIL